MPNLQERLQRIATQLQREHPAYAQLGEAFVQRLQAAGAGAGAPALGASLPPFLLPDISGRLVVPAELLAQGGLVIAFVRGHWCNFCRAEVEALWDAAEQIGARGASIALVTPERPIYARSMAHPLLRVLCDVDCGYAASLGLAVGMDTDLAQALERIGDNIKAYNTGAGWILPIPATFVLDQEGRIVGRFIDPDYRNRMSMEAILAALPHGCQQS